MHVCVKWVVVCVKWVAVCVKWVAVCVKWVAVGWGRGCGDFHIFKGAQDKVIKVQCSSLHGKYINFRDYFTRIHFAAETCNEKMMSSCRRHNG